MSNNDKEFYEPVFENPDDDANFGSLDELPNERAWEIDGSSSPEGDDNEKHTLEIDIPQMMPIIRDRTKKNYSSCQKEFLVNGAIGGVIGGIGGISIGKSSGIVAQTALKGAFSLGMFLAVQKGSMCSLQIYRGKNDLYNSFGSAFLAGCFFNLHTRSPTQIILSGISSGLIFTSIDWLLQKAGPKLKGL